MKPPFPLDHMVLNVSLEFGYLVKSPNLILAQRLNNNDTHTITNTLSDSKHIINHI